MTNASCPGRLDRDDRQQLVGGEANVRAVPWLAALGHPVLPEQSHHMVDAQSVHAAQRGAHGVDERLVQRSPQAPRNERWDAPALPIGVELVGRGADAHVQRQQIAVLVRVGTERREPDGQIADQRHPGGADLRELRRRPSTAATRGTAPCGIERRASSRRRRASVRQSPRSTSQRAFHSAIGPASAGDRPAGSERLEVRVELGLEHRRFEIHTSSRSISSSGRHRRCGGGGASMPISSGFHARRELG